MSMKFKRIRRVMMWVLIAFGICMLLLIQLVNMNELSEWKETITLIIWIYLGSVFIYIIFFNAIPMVRNYFRKR